MKSTSILGALSAVFIILAMGGANAGHATVRNGAAPGAHYLNPQPLPPG